MICVVEFEHKIEDFIEFEILRLYEIKNEYDEIVSKQINMNSELVDAEKTKPQKKNALGLACSQNLKPVIKVSSASNSTKNSKKNSPEPKINRASFDFMKKNLSKLPKSPRIEEIKNNRFLKIETKNDETINLAPKENTSIFDKRKPLKSSFLKSWSARNRPNN